MVDELVEKIVHDIALNTINKCERRMIFDGRS